MVEIDEFSHKIWISLVSKLLEEILSIPNENYEKRKILPLFEAKTLPSISIHSYLERIFKYSKCSDECLIAALIYIDRFTENNRNFKLDYYNIHRLFYFFFMFFFLEFSIKIF